MMKSLISPNLARFASLALLAAALTACGGGGGNPGTTVGVGSGSTGTGSNNPAALVPTITLALVDGSGNAITSLSGGQSGTLRTVVKNGLGVVVPNAIVNFKSTASDLVTFSPVAASALTDSSGVAVVSIKPANVTSAGALQITAESVVESKTASASLNMAVGAAPLTVGTLSFTPTPSGPLAAFSAVQLNIPVTSGGQPAATADGLTMSSLCQGDGTATLVQGSINNGVQAATYTNNGCLRGTDTITVGIGNSSKTITIGVTPASIGAINFVGSNLSGTALVLKGSGGQGRSEAAMLTFRVVDQHNNGLAGVDVDFRATTTTGGLLVSPSRATTDASGNVSTVVTAGTIPTPVRVVAEATRSGITISGLSDALTISTGLPIQRFMSLSPDKYNIEGLRIDNNVSNITVYLADQYGNRVADNTTVNFVTEGGAIGSANQGACNTLNGACTVVLRSQEVKPTNGRVTVTAFVQGVEDFVDSNGDGQYSCTNYKDVNGNVPTVYRPLVDICVSGGEPFSDMGDVFLDTGKSGSTAATRDPVTGLWPSNWLDGSYDPANLDLPIPYGHSSYSATGDNKWGLNYIRKSIEITFSGTVPYMKRQVCTNNVCRDWTAADGTEAVISGVAGLGCSTQTLAFRLYDENNNPMPVGTTIAQVDSDKLSPQTFSPNAVPSTNAIGGTIHFVNIKPDTACAQGSFGIAITPPSGSGVVTYFRSQ